MWPQIAPRLLIIYIHVKLKHLCLAAQGIFLGLGRGLSPSPPPSSIPSTANLTNSFGTFLHEHLSTLCRSLTELLQTGCIRDVRYVHGDVLSMALATNADKATETVWRFGEAPFRRQADHVCPEAVGPKCCVKAAPATATPACAGSS